MRKFLFILLSTFVFFSCEKNSEILPENIESFSNMCSYDTLEYELLYTLWSPPNKGQVRISGNHVDDFTSYDTIIIEGTSSNDGVYTISCNNITYNQSNDWTHFFVNEQMSAEGPISATLKYLQGSGDYPNIDSIFYNDTLTVDRFSLSNKIHVNGFGKFESGDSIFVSGSSMNDGAYIIDQVHYAPCPQKTVIYINGGISDEYPTYAIAIVKNE